jgi:hypothetical protein
MFFRRCRNDGWRINQSRYAAPPNVADAESARPVESSRNRFATIPLSAANAFPAAPAMRPSWPVLPIQPATGFRLLGLRGLGNTRLASEGGSPIARSSRCFVLSWGAQRPFEISTKPDHARPVRRCSSRRESPFRSAEDRTRFGYRGILRRLLHKVQSGSSA